MAQPSSTLPRKARVLSIQSHTTYGYVGNKVATLALQLLGMEVDSINTVSLSNHRHCGYYKSTKGLALSAEHFNTLMEGLHENELLGVDYILSGYIYTSSLASAIAKAIRSMKKERNVKYHLDTVLGDAGELYVPEELVTKYRDELLPISNVITPNAFEVGSELCLHWLFNLMLDFRCRLKFSQG
eukprot:271457_1